MRDLEENGAVDVDDDEGFVDVVAAMSVEEREEWEEAVVPIRNALTKVTSISAYECIAQYIC